MEVLFYALFPVLLATVTNFRIATAVLILAFIASFGIRGMLAAQYLALTPRPRWDPSYFAFGSNCVFFAFGIWAFYLRPRLMPSGALVRTARVLSLTLLAGLLFFQLATYCRAYGNADLLAWGFAFALLCAVESLKPSKLLANRIMEYFGEGSFSIYLVHPLILLSATPAFAAFRAWALPVVGPSLTAITELIGGVMLTIPLAEATYRLIEIPGINAGKAFAKRNANSSIS